MVAVYIIIGFVAGIIITFLLMKLQQTKLEQQSSFISQENSRLIQENAKFVSEAKDLIQENTSLKAQADSNKSSLDQLKESFERERNILEQQRKDIELNAEKLRNKSDEQWQIKFDKLKEEFQNTATQLLNAKQLSLQENNKEQLGEMLKPLQAQFDAFRKSVEESKTSNEVAKKELKDSFEATMKLFAQQQNQTVEALKQETIRIGNDANNLTNALKRDTKKQGNWGELILESLLESSGLE